MISVFADTSYLSALLSRRDSLHARAKSLSESLAGARIVTSDLVLIEFLNSFASSGPQSRRMAFDSVMAIRRSAEAPVESFTRESFDAALNLYNQRPDQSWSLTDCSSFLIMRRHGIESALTYDKHFEEAGFKALLR